MITNGQQETDLKGEALIRYRVVLPTDKSSSPLGGVIGLQLVFASQDRDWTSFLPKLRGARTGEDNPVVWFGKDWKRLNGMDELLTQRKNWWFIRDPFGSSKAQTAGW